MTDTNALHFVESDFWKKYERLQYEVQTASGDVIAMVNPQTSQLQDAFATIAMRDVGKTPADLVDIFNKLHADIGAQIVAKNYDANIVRGHVNYITLTSDKAHLASKQVDAEKPLTLDGIAALFDSKADNVKFLRIDGPLFSVSYEGDFTVFLMPRALVKEAAAFAEAMGADGYKAADYEAILPAMLAANTRLKGPQLAA